jgi:UDP-N-acetyl-D-galactosamine dehydrogenase
MYSSIVNKEKTISVIGLGYVGLPIALEFAKQVKVVGFDIKPDRVEMMKNRVDPSNELVAEDFDNSDIIFTADLEDLKDCHFHIVAVPTPIDEYNLPDLTPVLKASETVGKVLKKGDYVVYESTVYPGCTEEDCVPVLEKVSGLKYIEDFKVGFSPERINPGDKVHTLTSIVKVSSGCDAESAEEIALTYELIIKAGVHRASSLKVAEAAKIIENTQRDVNIALMNELSIIFDHMGINTFEVLEASGTKWNFLPFIPGLVGGHCIGVDPYYLTHKAEQIGYLPQVILAGRRINDGMGKYVAENTVKQMIIAGKMIKGARVLVLGLTFKEDVPDIRNTKVVDIVKELKDYGIEVLVHDPHADAEETRHEYGLELTDLNAVGKVDAVIYAVSHKAFADIGISALEKLCSNGGGKGVVVDVKSVFKRQDVETAGLTYWSL